MTARHHHADVLDRAADVARRTGRAKRPRPAARQPDLLSTGEAARLLGVDPERLVRLLNHYTVPTSGGGGGPGLRRRISGTDLDRLAVMAALDTAGWEDPVSTQLAAQLAAWPDLPRYVVVTGGHAVRCRTAEAAATVASGCYGLNAVIDTAAVCGPHRARAALAATGRCPPPPTEPAATTAPTPGPATTAGGGDGQPPPGDGA